MIGHTTAVLKATIKSCSSEIIFYLSFFTSYKRYSNQPGEHSIWASRNVSVSPVAISAPGKLTISADIHLIFDRCPYLSVETSSSPTVQYFVGYAHELVVPWRIVPTYLWDTLQKESQRIFTETRTRWKRTSINTGIINQYNFLDEFHRTLANNAG
jgi:hypothetical protein